MAEFKHLVRIANTDLKGEKQLATALRGIKGVGFQFANAVCFLAKVEKTKKVGDLTDAEIEKITGIINNPKDMPVWMLNRRKDYEDGTDKHLILGDLTFTKDNDVKRLKKIKANVGLRHHWGLPVRGQRTKSNFRKNKGKVTGVKKKKGKSGRV